MSIILFPVFERNRAYTIDAVARYYQDDVSFPNINSFELSKRYRPEDLVEQAAHHVAAICRHLLKYQREYLRDGRVLVFPTTYLFASLGLVGIKLEKRPTKLPNIWGRYTNAVLAELAKLPRDLVLFALDWRDYGADAPYLSMLALHPQLTGHKFLLSRPLPSESYVGKGKLNKRKSATQDTAILWCTYTDYKLLRKRDPKAGNLRLAARAGSFFIFD